MSPRPVLRPRSYDSNIAAIGALYEGAKAKHAHGIALLEAACDYHPAFSKGRPNEFRGKPFKPK
jgi:hypothetical protein